MGIKYNAITKKGKAEVINLDLLLNALNIHHLHLGEKIESDGFINRTGSILLCLFTDKVVYFILTVRHGERKIGVYKRKPGQKDYYNPWSKQVFKPNFLDFFFLFSIYLESAI